jgi:hypothetical protein
MICLSPKRTGALKYMAVQKFLDAVDGTIRMGNYSDAVRNEFFVLNLFMQ